MAGATEIFVGLTADSPTFFNVYWVLEGGSAFLGVLAMFESFYRVLRPYYTSKSWLFLMPFSTILIILSVSAWGLHKHSPVQAGPIARLYISFDLAADYMLAGFFGLFVVLVFLWQAKWQRYTFGIMKGFGLFSIVGMLADLLRSEFGTKWDFFFSYAPSVAYILGCLMWLGAFLATDVRTRPPGPGSVVDLDEIQELLSKLTKAIK